MIAALLASLAVVDAAFCGFRDAAGRDRRISKRSYYAKAIRHGMGFGLLLVALFGVGVGVLIGASEARPRKRYRSAKSTVWWSM